jgi:hypothetical protein
MARDLPSELSDYIYTVGVSCAGIRRDVADYVVEKLRPKVVFDLGCGSGCYGQQIRMRDRSIRMVGADGWLEYLASAHCIRYYDAVIRTQVNDIIDGLVTVPADLVLFMDVIEHLERDEGAKVLDFIETKYPVAILSTPLFDFPQGAVDGNELERHRSIWTEQELVQRGWRVLAKERWKEEGDVGAFIHG